MIHERFDLKAWIKKVPLERLNYDDDICSTLTGPMPIVYIEQIRERIRRAGGKLGNPVPVDVCIWNLGDSPNRSITKIGGTPYWPANEPWPKSGWRKPYTFLAQFCFADSQDIVPKLPGDILSILAGGNKGDQLFEYRWFKLGQELLPANKLPKPRWEIEPCHAVLHRTAEYPKADYQLFEQYRYPLNNWCQYFRDSTKIGGPWYMRGELPEPDQCEDPELRQSIEAAWENVRRAEQTFLCQLGSLTLSTTYPFLNIPSFDDLERGHALKSLTIGDVGGYDYFFDGKSVSEECWSG